MATSPAAVRGRAAESSTAGAGSDVLAAGIGGGFVKDEPVGAGASSTALEELGGSSSSINIAVAAAAASESVSLLHRMGSEKGVAAAGVPAAAESAVAAELERQTERDAALDGNGVAGVSATAGTVVDDSSAADDVAHAIAQVTAGFAMPAPDKTQAQAGEEVGEDGFAKPKPRLASGGRCDAVAGKESSSGDKKGSGRTTRAGGVSSSLMRGTASSTSRLKLNVPSALEESRSGSAPRSASRRPSTGESRPTALL